MNNISKYLASALLASFFVGCGGSTEPKESIETSSIYGIATDDLIVNGDVRVYPVGNPSNVLVSGKTDPVTGSYTFDVNHAGVVVVEVECGTTGRMKNPETNVTKECESDLKLHSAAEVSPEIGEIEVNISPVTDFVVSQLEAGGGTVAALERAQENIGKIFGFNPIATNPTTHANYSRTVSAIRELADDKNATLVEVIKEINDDLIDGTSGDDGEIATELAGVMKEKGIVNDFTDNNGSVETDDTVATKSDVEISKEFFAQLRTQAMSVVDYNGNGTPGFLDNEAKNLGTVLDDAALNLDVVGEYSVGLLDTVMKAIDNNMTTDSKVIDLESTQAIERVATVTKSSALVWDYSITDNGVEAYSGMLALPASNPDDINLSNFTTLNLEFNGTLPLKRSYSAEAADSQDVKMSAEVKKTSIGATLEVKELSVTHGTTALSVTNLKGAVSYVNNEDLSTGLRFVQFDSMAVRGNVAGYQLDGNIAIPTYVTNASISDHNFSVENYTTYINGYASCRDEQNNSLAWPGGNVVFTDVSGGEHTLATNEGGSLDTTIERDINQGDEFYRQSESYYEGVELDNVEVTSNSCTNIVLDDVYMSYDSIFTYIGIAPLCSDNGGMNSIMDAEGTFTDSTGIAHTLENIGGALMVQYEGNSENIEINNPLEFSGKGYVLVGIEDDRIMVEAPNCPNPVLEYFYVSGYSEGEDIYNSGKIPKKVSFTGAIKNTSNNSEINGTLSVDWLNAATMDITNNSDEEPLVDVSFIGKIQMPERPLMTLSIGFTNPNDRNNFAFSYAYDSTTINGTGLFDKEMDNGTITLDSHNGLRALVKVTNGEVIYGAASSVKRNGRLVGQLEEREGVPVIKYTDGTFESLP